MPRQGKITEDYAANKGLIACGPISRVLNEWLEEQFDEDGQTKVTDSRESSPCMRLAAHSGLSLDLIYRISRYEKEWVRFDNADKIICATYGPMHWIIDPELNALYQSFDFTCLDLRNPPVPDADGVLTLYDSGIRASVLARLYGVHQTTFMNGVKAQRKRLVAA